MGNLLSCFYNRSKTKSASIKPQPLSVPQTSNITEGSRDEHLSSVPPSVAPQDSAIGTTALKSGDGASAVEGVAQATKNVGVEAPLPIATSSKTDRDTNPKRGGGTMASDEDYMAFLDKANQDPSAGTAKSASKKAELKATDSGAKVPAVLSKAVEDQYYISDADEPFEPVYLKMTGKTLPDEVTFAKLVSHPSPSEAEVQIMDIGEWDPQGQYKELVEAVREASKGSDVRVYRIAREGSRAEYWLVGLAGGKLVGVKALAVES